MRGVKKAGRKRIRRRKMQRRAKESTEEQHHNDFSSALKRTYEPKEPNKKQHSAYFQIILFLGFIEEGKKRSN